MSPNPSRVLVLGDDPATLQLLFDHVGDPRLEVVGCCEVEAASCLVGRERFDALVTSLDVSRVGARNVFRLIENVARRLPKAQIFVLSADLDATMGHLSRALGATALLDRTADLGRLRDLVTAGLAIPAEGSSDERGSVTEVETLDEFLKNRSIAAKLRPIVALDGNSDDRPGFGLEGLTHGPESSRLRDPEVFLDYAEQKNRLFELELECMKAILVEADHLPSVGKLFVEFRSRTLLQPEFVTTVENLVRGHGYDPRELVIAVADNFSILEPGALAATLDALRECEFGIALDGNAGVFSNLDLFWTLRPDYLKIDFRTASGLRNDRRTLALLRSVIESLRSMGVETIVQGIETEQELALMRELAVGLVQGDCLSEPRSGRELADTFRPVARSQPAVEPEGFESDAEHELANFLTTIALIAGECLKTVAAADPLHQDLAQILAASERAVVLSQQIRQTGRSSRVPSE